MEHRINTFFILVLVLLFFSCKEDEIPLAAIAEPYQDITVIDIHNHDASGYKFENSFDIWDKYGIDRIVLFGDISEPSAITTTR